MNNIYSNVNKKLAQRRGKNQKDLEKRREESFGLLPRLREIEEEEKVLGFELVKAAALGRDKTKELEERSKKLREERVKLLSSLGKDQAYLDPIYTCQLCKDQGVLGTQWCRCKKTLLTKELYQASGLSKTIEKENFENFDLNIFRANRNGNEPVSPREMMEINLRHAKNYVKNFESLEKKNLVYMGDVGTGKTYLLNSIAKALMDQGRLVVYKTSQDLMNFISSYNFSKASERESYQAEYDLISNSELLIIDDLGTEIGSSVNDTNLFEVINSRIVSDKATIISTNLDANGIKDLYGPRVMSRIIGTYDIKQVFGDDLRIKQNFRLF